MQSQSQNTTNEVVDARQGRGSVSANLNVLIGNIATANTNASGAVSTAGTANNNATLALNASTTATTTANAASGTAATALADATSADATSAEAMLVASIAENLAAQLNWEIANARYPYIDLATKLLALGLPGSGNVVATLTSGAISGATVLTVNSTTGFLVGQRVSYLNGASPPMIEGNTITAIGSSTSLTLGTALTASLPSGRMVYTLSEWDYQAAQVPTHPSGTTYTLYQAMRAVDHRIVNVSAFPGWDNTGGTDMTSLVHTAIDAGLAAWGQVTIWIDPVGNPRMNLVIGHTRSNVTICSEMYGIGTTSPGISPYDVTKPTIQLGEIASDTFSVRLRGLHFLPPQVGGSLGATVAQQLLLTGGLHFVTITECTAVGAATDGLFVVIADSTASGVNAKNMDTIEVLNCNWYPGGSNTVTATVRIQGTAYGPGGLVFRGGMIEGPSAGAGRAVILDHATAVFACYIQTYAGPSSVGRAGIRLLFTGGSGASVYPVFFAQGATIDNAGGPSLITVESDVSPAIVTPEAHLRGHFAGVVGQMEVSDGTLLAINATYDFQDAPHMLDPYVQGDLSISAGRVAGTANPSNAIRIFGDIVSAVKNLYLSVANGAGALNAIASSFFINNGSGGTATITPGNSGTSISNTSTLQLQPANGTVDVRGSASQNLALLRMSHYSNKRMDSWVDANGYLNWQAVADVGTGSIVTLSDIAILLPGKAGASSSVLPTADAAHRGCLARTIGAGGDHLYICELNASSAYVWRAI